MNREIDFYYAISENGFLRPASVHHELIMKQDFTASHLLQIVDMIYQY